MNALEKLRKLREQDRSMGRWMKGIGVVVAALAAFFLTKDFAQGGLAQILLIGCALIGAATFALGWLPHKHSEDFQREALSEYMREQLRDENSNVTG